MRKREIERRISFGCCRGDIAPTRAHDIRICQIRYDASQEVDQFRSGIGGV